MSRVIVSHPLDSDQVRDLDKLAKQRRTSRSSLVREAVDAYLASRMISDPMTESMNPGTDTAMNPRPAEPGNPESEGRRVA